MKVQIKDTFFHFPKKRCENGKDSHRTVIHKVNYSNRVKFPQHLKRFEVTMFTFIEGTTPLQKQVRYLWFVVHCQWSQCMSLEQRMQQMLWKISAGPVLLGAVSHLLEGLTLQEQQIETSDSLAFTSSHLESVHIQYLPNKTPCTHYKYFYLVAVFPLQRGDLQHYATAFRLPLSEEMQSWETQTW